MAQELAQELAQEHQRLRAHAEDVAARADKERHRQLRRADAAHRQATLLATALTTALDQIWIEDAEGTKRCSVCLIAHGHNHKKRCGFHEPQQVLLAYEKKTAP